MATFARYIYRPGQQSITLLQSGRGCHFSPQIEIAYLGAQTRFYYNYDQTRIIENDQYNFSVQQAGVDFTAGNAMKIGHYLGANLNRRSNQPDYDYFDTGKPKAFTISNISRLTGFYLKAKSGVL
jgi:hypothetical protein